MFCITLTSAQSLAEQTKENTSLYDAVCIINNIEPGSIGMNEGRKLMLKYAQSIGLKYELYQLNDDNNLHILHYDRNSFRGSVGMNVDVDMIVKDHEVKSNMVLDSNDIEYTISESTVLAADLNNSNINRKTYLRCRILECRCRSGDCRCDSDDWRSG